MGRIQKQKNLKCEMLHSIYNMKKNIISLFATHKHLIMYFITFAALPMHWHCWTIKSEIWLGKKINPICAFDEIGLEYQYGNKNKKNPLFPLEKIQLFWWKTWINLVKNVWRVYANAYQLHFFLRKKIQFLLLIRSRQE